MTAMYYRMHEVQLNLMRYNGTGQQGTIGVGEVQWDVMRSDGNGLISN